jgi:hypothetical protein
VRLEQRIVVRAEMSRYALSLNRSAKHATDVGARGGTGMHADAHETTRELVHDDEHPVTGEFQNAGESSDSPWTAHQVTLQIGQSISIVNI